MVLTSYTLYGAAQRAALQPLAGGRRPQANRLKAQVGQHSFASLVELRTLFFISEQRVVNIVKRGYFIASKVTKLATNLGYHCLLAL